MIIETITNQDHFYNWLQQSSGYKNSFTKAGAHALQSYLDELSDETETPTEFDPIAWCSEFTEYATADEAASEYFDYEGMEYNEDGDELLTAEDVEAKANEYLLDKTTVIGFDGGIIIGSF